MEETLKKHPDVSVMINFASFRSVYTTVMETLEYSDQIKTIAIIAEGVPESQTRMFNKAAHDKGVGIIGPATVGGIKPGCFRIGNTGGMLDNIVMSKLYRPGSVAYVSKSGGMSNELNNIICRNSDGVYEGIAIGGDRYPGSLFIDHLLRYNDNPDVHILVLLGEVGECVRIHCDAKKGVHYLSCASNKIACFFLFKVGLMNMMYAMHSRVAELRSLWWLGVLGHARLHSATKCSLVTQELWLAGEFPLRSMKTSSRHDCTPS